NRARVSWIRAAYVVAFARFGWSYLFQIALDPMRRHFRDPTTAELPILSMTDPDADTARREIWILERPVEKQCVAVVIGQYTVILPLPNDTRSLDDLSRAWVGDHDISQRVVGTASGVLFPWPGKPMYSFDPVPVPEQQSDAGG